MKAGQKSIKCYRCDGWGHGLEGMSHSGKVKLEGTSGGHSFINAWKSWFHSYTNPESKSMIYKVLKHNYLHHNQDPLLRLLGEVNETNVLVEGQEVRALIDSGSQLSAISLEWVKKLNLRPQQLQSILQIEGLGGLKIPYLGYAETCLGIPEIKVLILMSSY